MTTLYLIRHGTTENNKNKILQGTIDTPLSSEGLKQAECLATHFADKPIDAVYTSPLQRASIVADAICSQHPGLSPIECKDIKEIDYGILQGHTPDENFAAHFKQTFNMYNHPALFVAPSGESFEQLYIRVCKAIREIVYRHSKKTVAVVSHGYAILAYLAYARSIPFSKIKMDIVDNCSVSCFRYKHFKAKPTILYLNDCAHLPKNL